MDGEPYASPVERPDVGDEAAFAEFAGAYAFIGGDPLAPWVEADPDRLEAMRVTTEAAMKVHEQYARLLAVRIVETYAEARKGS